MSNPHRFCPHDPLPWSYVATVTTLAILIPVALGVGLAVGWWLTRRLTVP